MAQEHELAKVWEWDSLGSEVCKDTYTALNSYLQVTHTLHQPANSRVQASQLNVKQCMHAVRDLRLYSA